MQDETQEQKSADGATPVAHGSTASAASATGGQCVKRKGCKQRDGHTGSARVASETQPGQHPPRQKPPTPKEPFNPPAITVGSVVGSIVVRLGIPLALAARPSHGTPKRAL